MASTPFYMSTDGLLFVVKPNGDKERAMTDDEHLKYNTSQFEMNTAGNPDSAALKFKNKG